MSVVIRFTPILPKKFNSTALIAESRRAMKEAQSNVFKDFTRTTKTWKHPPTFDQSFKELPNEMRFEVSTTDEVYGYVNYGTKPHDIEGNPFLAFMSAYKAKTKPRVINSYAGGGSDPTIIRQKVHHPGTEARDFDTAIVAKEAPEMSRLLKLAVKKARVASGHPA